MFRNDSLLCVELCCFAVFVVKLKNQKNANNCILLTKYFSFSF